jgi:multidrug efflux pump subunit AcrA (membrane-fusion protein)
MRARTIVIPLAVIAVAIAGVYVIPSGSGRSAAPSRSAAHARYQCSMHPQIVQDHPGKCPICQMTLQRVDAPATTAADPPTGTRTPLFYRHPMRPDVTSPVPTKDEMGMDYIPVYSDELGGVQTAVAGRAGFTLSAERQQLIGVTRAPVERRRLDAEIRAVGTVAYDPALYQAIMEYRQALGTSRRLGTEALREARAGAEGITRSAALRLRQLGLGEQQIRDLAAAGPDPVDLLLPGPTMWVYAQVYEYEMAAVHSGQGVSITTPARHGQTYEGRVVTVDPILSSTTRTARVRVRVATPDAGLHPEQFVHAVIHVPSDEVVAVPADAVLLAGRQQIVFVTGDDGTFTPRAVRLGREAGGFYEVLDGVQPGDQVVTSANFLIDSESRFRAALAAFSSKTAPGQQH